MSPSDGALEVARGTCFVLFTYDVARSIDLAACQRQLPGATTRRAFTPGRRAMEYFAYRPTPLHVALEAPPIRIGDHLTAPGVDIVLYDFGAVSVTYSIPLTGPLEAAAELAQAVARTGSFLDDSRRRVDAVLAPLRGALEGYWIADVVEDYLIFDLEELAPALPAEALYSTHAAQFARLLRAEPRPLSGEETRDAVAAHITLDPAGVTLVDWGAALVYRQDIGDLRTVIEFANLQLLELRFLDRQLDEALERSYAVVAGGRPGWRSILRSHRAEMQRIARLQVDAAVLFERVTSALKVFGEESLSRLYDLIGGRFRLADWNASILRKLQTLDSIYAKLADAAAARRMEILEWMIVILIALSILVSLGR
jgi:hypothetical protein